jgi:hypothetical protein
MMHTIFNGTMPKDTTMEAFKDRLLAGQIFMHLINKEFILRFGRAVRAVASLHARSGTTRSPHVFLIVPIAPLFGKTAAMRFGGDTASAPATGKCIKS